MKYPRFLHHKTKILGLDQVDLGILMMCLWVNLVLGLESIPAVITIVVVMLLQTLLRRFVDLKGLWIKFNAREKAK